jgi:hypothetical protein
VSIVFSPFLAWCEIEMTKYYRSFVPRQEIKEQANQDLRLHPGSDLRPLPDFNSMPGKLPIYSELAMV